MAHGSMTLKWAFLNLEIQVIRVFLVKRDFCVFNVDIVMCGLSFNSTIFGIPSRQFPQTAVISEFEILYRPPDFFGVVCSEWVIAL